MAAWNFCLLYHSEVIIDYCRIKYLVYYSVAKYNCVLEMCFKLYLYNVLIPKDLHLSLSSLVILKHNWNVTYSTCFHSLSWLTQDHISLFYILCLVFMWLQLLCWLELPRFFSWCSSFHNITLCNNNTQFWYTCFVLLLGDFKKTLK